MKIGIIGAGPTGLVFLKELLAQGHDCLCFEVGATIGGVFAKNYANARFTSSNVLTSFSDFSDGKESQPKIWTFTEYLDYLNRYSNHFNLLPRIKLQHKILELDKTGSQYELLVEKTDSPALLHYQFDRIAICCGTHQAPAYFDEPGMDRFKGSIIHSSEFKQVKPFTGKRVLIVGAGESSSDISLEISKVADKTAVSIRNHTGHIVWRNASDLEDNAPNKGASDLGTCRALHSLPHWMGPKIARKRFLKVLATYENKRPVLAKIASINLEQKSSSLTRFGTKNASLVRAMIEHGCERKPGIKKFDEHAVHFVDGSTFVCDIVLAATGFRNSFPFLEKNFPEFSQAALLPRQNLFKHCFHPDLGADIIWGGFARPAFGAIPPISELQARWFALLCSGKISLPAKEIMKKTIRRDNNKAMAQFSEDAERLPALTDFLQIMDGVAEQIGCLPKGLFWTYFDLWKRIQLCPITGAQYRLKGPGKAPEKAKEILLNTPYRPESKRFLFYNFLFNLLATIPFLGRRFQPAVKRI